MANTITLQTLVDGSTNLVVKAHIVGDNSGDEAATVLIDASAYSADSLKIEKIYSSLAGFSVNLIWDATTNVDIVTLTQSDSTMDFREFGGLWNNAGTGKTGDILMDTVGLGAEEGTLILCMRKS